MLNNYYKNKAKQLYEMGHKPYKIAWMLDMSYNQVYAYIRTLGHTQGKIPYTEEEKDTIIRMWNDEHPAKDIAVALNRSTSSIQGMVSRLQREGILCKRKK